MVSRGCPAFDHLVSFLSSFLQLFRHGDRSPATAFPTDPHQESAWPQGFGQLTQVGMRQQYELGQYLRTRYKDFLNESYIRHEVRRGNTTFIPSKQNLHKQSHSNLLGLFRSRHNMSAPDWVTPDVMEKLRFLTDFGFQLLFGVYKQQEKSRLQGGLLLGEIVKNLTKMAASHPQQQLKLMMLSAHDTTVVALQASLNVFNGKQAPYASCHIIELYREDDGSASVSMFYRNDTGVEPYPVQLPGCAHVCPLEDFVRITKPFISDDRDKECQILFIFTVLFITVKRCTTLNPATLLPTAEDGEPHCCSDVLD
uniref:Lysosomal acid phosphatase n=1 Tax=Poecilia latipinna TaxID=48699 RepID=A0A3B3VGI0_9TELE